MIDTDSKAVIQLDDDDDDIVIEEVKPAATSDSGVPPVKRKRLNATPVPEDPKSPSAAAQAPNSLKEQTPEAPPVLKPQQSLQHQPTPAPSTAANGKAQETPSVQSSSAAITTTTTTINNNNNNLTAKTDDQLTSYSALLDCLQAYVDNAIEKNDGVERKVLDVLLAAINIQVHREPHSVRQLIVNKELVLPNTISIPPSQVVDLVIEHDADMQLCKAMSRMFGDEKPKVSEQERRERQMLKSTCPAPSMTKLLMDIGQDLVQETTYADIVHARNLPEVPKNMETYNQVAAQLKPVWENLRAKNTSYHLRVFTCQMCGFKTDNRVVFSIHCQTPHVTSGRKWWCAICSEHDTSEWWIQRHYIETHGLKLLPREEAPLKMQCPICEEDFMYKGHRDAHLKICKRDVQKLRYLQCNKPPEDVAVVNRWLWDKPPLEPSIIAQQQQQSKQQQQLLLQQQQQKAAAAAAAAAAQHQQKLTTAQQQQQQLLAAQARIKNQLTMNGVVGSPAAGSTAANALNAAAQRLQQQQLSQLLARNGVPTQLTPQVIQAALKLRQQQAGGAINNNNKAGLQQLGGALQSAAAAAVNQLAKQQQQSRFSSAGTAATPPGRSSVPSMTWRTSRAPKRSSNAATLSGSGNASPSIVASSSAAGSGGALALCEICDAGMRDRESYLAHLQSAHQQMRGKTSTDMAQGAPLACSRCKERFWTYEGLERHLVMAHGLVTGDLLSKAQRKEDGGRCKLCGKQYAFNMLQHLVSDHKVKLCSAEIMYSCDVCSFKCSSYQNLETHLTQMHPKNPQAVSSNNNNASTTAR